MNSITINFDDALFRETGIRTNSVSLREASLKIGDAPYTLRTTKQNVAGEETLYIGLYDPSDAPVEDLRIHHAGSYLPGGYGRPSRIGDRSAAIRCASHRSEYRRRFSRYEYHRFHSTGRAYTHQETSPTDTVILHPRFREWAEKYPEFYQLEQCCPPLAQIMTACRNRSNLSVREEKVIFQTIGFLNRKKTLIHLLMSEQPDYNPHLTDYKLSQIRGTPLGCARIHSLLGFTGDLCRFENATPYAHPLLHLKSDQYQAAPKSEKIENLQSVLESLKVSILVVQQFL
jgi:hypothetical protein